MNISNDKKSFYQWEINRFLVDEDFKINQEVCFSSVKLRKALVVKTKLKNNKIVVEVPNLLLQDYHPIMVHWVIADENGKYVTKEQEFQVLKRAKPEDYVYTETEIFSFLDLEQRLKNLEEEGINKAIADYFVKNPIQSGATSEQAAQIIQNKENIEKLNKNKLDADKLPEAINNALTQAEASGAFKGEPGKDGVVPVTGAAVGQTVKITAVDENGNPTEWKATDFPESSTQTDWNQNDPTAPDYVKNRTHYEGEIKNIFGEGTATVITNDYSSDRNLYKTDCVLPVAEYIIGEEYIVNINGEEYIMKLTSQNDMSSGLDHIGFNIDVNESGNILHSPYFISGAAFGLAHDRYAINNPLDGDIVALSLTLYLPQGSELPVTVQVYQSDYELKQLDPKYIKDMYHTETVQKSETREFVGGEITDAEFAALLYKNRQTAVFTHPSGRTFVYLKDDSSDANHWFVKTDIEEAPPLQVRVDGDTIKARSFTSVTVNYEAEEVHQLDPKYIKDMYYDEENVIFEYVANTTRINNVGVVSGFDINKLYIFELNGVDYQNVPTGNYWSPAAFGEYNWFGSFYNLDKKNLTEYVGWEDTNYPFCFAYRGANDSLVIINEEISFPATFKIKERIIRQIDHKYLPILEEGYETIFKANVTDFIELTGPEYGKLLGKYSVVIDGVSKTVEFINDGNGSFVETDSFFIESWTDPEGNADNNGFYIEFVNQDGNPHSVEILAIKDVIKEEYLPDSVTAKPDWNQSDEASSDYVKNRTHYDDINHYLIDGAFVNLDINQLYTVQIYDDIYENVPVYNAGTRNDPRWGVGDMRVVNYPFGFFKYPCWPSNDIINTELSMISFDRNIYPDATINDVQIYQRTIKHLDPKYIKDMYYEEENILLEYKTNEPVIMVQLDKPNGFDKNKSYIFEVNGVEYKDVPSGTGSNNALGGYAWCGSHLNLNGAVWDETFYPFCFTRGLGSESIYISINDTVDFPATFKLKEEKIVHKLDAKYLPDSVKGMLVTVSEDAEGNLVASNNSEEIIAAYEAGVCVRLEYNGLVHDLTLIMENMPIFLCMVPNSQTNIGVYMIVVNADYTINVQEESYNIPTIDATLAIEGAAADAKATGDAISAVSALVGDVAVSEQISSALAESAVLYSEAQTLTKEQKAQARANISKYDWRDITIANTNYTIADYSQSLASNFAEAYAFDIDNALACTGVVSANYSSIATIAHMTAILVVGVLNGSSSTVTRLKNIIKEYENLKTQNVIGNMLTVCHKGSNDNISLGYAIAATTVAGYTHEITIVESVEGYKGRILYNNETNDYTTEYFMYNYNDASLTKQGYIADAKAVGDALVTKVSFTEAQELTEEQKQQAQNNIGFSETDAIELAAKMGLVSPTAAEDGSIYTDENGALYSL